MVGVTFTGDVTFIGPMFDIHDNEHVHIHSDRMMPEEVGEPVIEEVVPEEKEEEVAEELNFFAPAKHLKIILEEDWFFELRSDKRYTKQWIELFVDALLASEWRTLIAQEWQKKSKRTSLKGSVIGCLKIAGVISGSDLSIASHIINGNVRDNKTFATYIGRGRKRPFCEWICRYVETAKT